MKYNVAMIGTGYMARKHCDALASLQEVCLHTICSTERSQHVAREFRERYGFCRNTTDTRSILADTVVDIVFICTPDSTHPRYVMAALEAGKHVFCEKPLARAEADFREIRKRLDSSGLVLQVGMNNRFREQRSIPKRMVAAGELGELRFLRGTYIYNVVRSIRTGEKTWWLEYPPDILPFLHGGGIHCLDLLRWIGGEVKSVFARAAAFELTEVYRGDTFSISFEFANGALGELLVANSAFRPNDFTLELWLSRGSIVGRKVFRRDGDGLVPKEDEIIVEQKVIDLALQYEDMVRAIETQRPPLNSFEEAYANFGVLKAIEQSIQGKRLITV